MVVLDEIFSERIFFDLYSRDNLQERLTCKNMDTLTTALHWLTLGIAPIPLLLSSKAPLIQWRKYQTILPSEREVQSWFNRPRNIALITGWADLVVLDFDTMDAYKIWLDWAGESLAAQITYCVLTARGVHVYLAITEPVVSYKINGVVEVRSKGQYVCAPPSIHPSGAPYLEANPDAPIVRVNTLAEVLPAAWLLPPPILSTTHHDAIPVLPSDIWGRASGDLVAQAKQHRIEEWFTLARPTGEGWLIDYCPFHDDRRPGGTPSMWINTARQICGCYSPRCVVTKPMDVINFYARLHSVTNADAIRMLALRM
jgi:bifunctional DNA primase/polymerase-like protein